MIAGYLGHELVCKWEVGAEIEKQTAASSRNSTLTIAAPLSSLLIYDIFEVRNLFSCAFSADPSCSPRTGKIDRDYQVKLGSAVQRCY